MPSISTPLKQRALLEKTIADGLEERTRALAADASFAPDEQGRSPLARALLLGEIGCARAIFEVAAKARPEELRAMALCDGFLGPTPLCLAAAAGDAALLADLLPWSNPRQTYSVGSVGLRIALMEAAESGTVECVEILLPHSDLNAQSEMGESPLSLAAAYGKSECLARLLKEPGVDIQNRRRPNDAIAHVRDRWDHPLAQAIDGDYFECFSLLVPFFDLNASMTSNPHGRTPLLAAVSHGSIFCLEALLLLVNPAAEFPNAERVEEQTAFRFALHGVCERHWGVIDAISARLIDLGAFTDAHFRDLSDAVQSEGDWSLAPRVRAKMEAVAISAAVDASGKGMRASSRGSARL